MEHKTSFSVLLRIFISPFMFLKYLGLGLFVTLYIFVTPFTIILSTFIKYLLYGFIVLSNFLYNIIEIFTIKFPVFTFIGFTVIMFVVSNIFIAISKFLKKLFAPLIEKLLIQLEKNKTKKEAKAVKKREQKKNKEEIQKAKIQEKHERNKKRKNDVFINENVKIEKKSTGEHISGIFSSIINSPKTFINKIKNSYSNSTAVRYVNNKKLLNSEALMIDFEGDDAKKSENKILYEYIAKNEEGKIIKGYLEAFSKVEVHSFLLSENLIVYSIKTNRWITLFHKGEATNKTKIKNKDLIFFLTQLSTYLKSGITLVESLKILTRQYKDKRYQKIFNSVVYSLTIGDSFSDALLKQGNAFPRILINMVKTSEMTGELPEVLDDMADHFEKIDKTRKEMINSLMYPCLVFVFSIGVIIFLMLFVIPKFVEIYDSMDSSAIPAFTMFIMHLSEFLKKYIILLIIGVIVVCIGFYQMYKRVRSFRTGVQWVLMKMPVIGNVIIYNEVTMFTKTLASLQKHNVYITESMDILNRMTNNEIYKMLILNTITNLSKGDKISDAFKGEWAFPVPAYEMLVTGEKTGELPEMMDKVATYYQTLQESSAARIKTFIEPILIVFLTAIVGAIVLAIIIPMFSMYSAIQ